MSLMITRSSIKTFLNGKPVLVQEIFGSVLDKENQDSRATSMSISFAMGILNNYAKENDLISLTSATPSEAIYNSFSVDEVNDIAQSEVSKKLGKNNSIAVAMIATFFLNPMIKLFSMYMELNPDALKNVIKDEDKARDLLEGMFWAGLYLNALD